MSVQAKCPGCGHEFIRPDGLAGEMERCPKCRYVFRLPAAPPELESGPSLAKFSRKDGAPDELPQVLAGSQDPESVTIADATAAKSEPAESSPLAGVQGAPMCPHSGEILENEPKVCCSCGEKSNTVVIAQLVGEGPFRSAGTRSSGRATSDGISFKEDPIVAQLVQEDSTFGKTESPRDNHCSTKKDGSTTTPSLDTFGNIERHSLKNGYTEFTVMPFKGVPFHTPNNCVACTLPLDQAGMGNEHEFKVHCAQRMGPTLVTSDLTVKMRLCAACSTRNIPVTEFIRIGFSSQAIPPRLVIQVGNPEYAELWRPVIEEYAERGLLVLKNQARRLTGIENFKPAEAPLTEKRVTPGERTWLRPLATKSPKGEGCLSVLLLGGLLGVCALSSIVIVTLVR